MVPVSILVSVALGCTLVLRFAGLSTLQPRWAAWLLVLGAGIAVGIGLSSCLFFVLEQLVPGVPRLALYVRLALLAAAGYACWRQRRQAASPESPLRLPSTALLWIAFGLSLALVTLGMSTSWESNPQGNWDAWSIWNLRAKFLAAGHGLAPRAWSPKLDFTHPEYPLLLSGFVANCWTDAGAISDTAPIATSYLFFLALLFMVTGGMAALRGGTAGLLAGLCLMGIPAFLREAPAQYADVPLACYMAGAVLLALLDRAAWSGVLAGLAGWTKDEGLLFLVILLATIAVFKRARLPEFCGGAAPAAALVLTFKLVLARGTQSLASGAQTGLAARLTDWGRYRMTGSAMFREVLNWNVGWYHPLLPIVVLAIVLRFDRGHLRDSLACLTTGLSMVIAYFGVYLITPNDLQWQLQTSLTRLFVQICPLLLIAAFVAMRWPLPALVPPPKPDHRRRRKANR